MYLNDLENNEHFMCDGNEYYVTDKDFSSIEIHVYNVTQNRAENLPKYTKVNKINK